MTGNTELAMQIAVIHLIYNVLGVIFIFGMPVLRNIPLHCADWLANLATERKSLALAYIVAVFFLVPGLLVGISSMI